MLFSAFFPTIATNELSQSQERSVYYDANDDGNAATDEPFLSAQQLHEQMAILALDDIEE